MKILVHPPNISIRYNVEREIFYVDGKYDPSGFVIWSNIRDADHSALQSSPYVPNATKSAFFFTYWAKQKCLLVVV